MSTKLANVTGPHGMGMHAAGIFADMTVDGPEIGTLVLIVDRAKNLPNRKTMGKQSAYCAARLGKEAKKTETDKRGGQTPKWDQELRFTVHDSPDYYNLKISVFSEDKRTDLIGEAWIDLGDIVVPGGGKNDIWQGLNCKGKYAGEIRFEMTYYDTRPKPEKSVAGGEEEAGVVASRQSVAGGTKVKRRPLPTNPNHAAVTPDTIPEGSIPMPGRAKHGPRDYRTPSRAHSTPPETVHQHQHPHSMYGAPPLAHSASHGNSPQVLIEQTPALQGPDDVQQYPQPQHEAAYQQPDFLPQLPPSDRQVSGPRQRMASRQAQPSPLRPRAQTHGISLQHSHSAPVTPQAHPERQGYDAGYQLHTGYPEPIPDVDYQHMQLRQRRSDVPPGWQEEYGDPYAHMQQASVEEDFAPPPPPTHSYSAPVVPRVMPSPTGRQISTPPEVSPNPTTERGYGASRRNTALTHPARGKSFDEYASPLGQGPYADTPSSLVPGHASSPYARSPAARALPHRHSVADTYGNTPPRPHPLSQEVPRARSPLPEPPQQQYGQPPYQHDYRTPPAMTARAISPRPPPLSQEMPRARSPLPEPSQQYGQPSYQQEYRPLPIAAPRAISPRPPMMQTSRSSYSLQHPVRAFESADASPLSTSHSNPHLPQIATRNSTTRKALSPRPSPTTDSPGGIPFGPDSFDVHNPHTRPSPLANSSPHTPYQVSPNAKPGASAEGPIVGWHGQEIDPSDHLPVDSWAPEPTKKTPNKTYGQGRDRDFGPRGVATTTGRVSKDTLVQYRGAGKDEGPQQDHEALRREISQIDIGGGGSRYRRAESGGGGAGAPIAFVPVRSHRDRGSYY